MENQHKFHYRSEKVGRVNCNCFGKDSYHQPSDVLTRLQININIYHFLQALRYYATRLTLCTNFLFNNTSTLPLAFVFWTVGFNVCFWYLITFLKSAFVFKVNQILDVYEKRCFLICHTLIFIAENSLCLNIKWKDELQ